MTQETRPDIAHICTGAELRRWYWLKAELVTEARRRSLPTGGAKFELLDRLAHYLDTGEVLLTRKPAPSSRFDWQSADLSDETPLTDSYRNTQNVRRYFTSRLGKSFRFNTTFMAWLKANAGRTLAEACAEYRAMKERETAPSFQSDIAQHNQFNQYTRDFLADNPALGMEDVRRVWALKRALPPHRAAMYMPHQTSI